MRCERKKTRPTKSDSFARLLSRATPYRETLDAMLYSPCHLGFMSGTDGESAPLVRLRDQFRILHLLCTYHLGYGYAEQVWHFPPVESVLEFRQIAVQVLVRDLVERADNAALEERERGFD